MGRRGSRDGLPQAITPDEPHGVIRPSVAVGAQTVDRYNAGMLQAAGDLGLHQEPLAAHRVVGVVFENLLQRHLAVQFAIERHEDGPSPPRAWGRRTRNRWPSADAEMTKSGLRSASSSIKPESSWAMVPLERRGTQGGEQLSGRAAGWDRGEALLGIAAVLLQVQGHHRLDCGPAVGGHAVPVGQMVGQRSRRSRTHA